MFRNQWLGFVLLVSFFFFFFFLLIPAFKHIPERLYASLPRTVIKLIARDALNNAVLSQYLRALQFHFL